MTDIEANVRRIRREIAEAARACGRDPKDILLCAATKMNDADAVRRAVAAGVDLCGENRVQELREKAPLGAYDPKPIHFIGRLQTNKVKYLVGKVGLIQSVDRLELVQALEKEAAKQSLRQDILLEINIGGEESKGGFSPAEAAGLAARAADFPHLHICGLMAIPPIAEKKGENRKYFAEIRQLAVDIGAKKYDNVSMDCLSMGMSGDFADAIAEGSTMIRIGTAIFGARDYGQSSGR